MLEAIVTFPFVTFEVLASLVTVGLAVVLSPPIDVIPAYSIVTVSPNNGVYGASVGHATTVV